MDPGLVLCGHRNVLDPMAANVFPNHFLECCLAIGHLVVHVAQVTTAFHRTVPPVFNLSTLHQRDGCPFFHSATCVTMPL